ncbi:MULTISPECIES: glycosyltransferase family 25 protein [Glaesserella]|uniref:Lsg locus protein 4 n=1 Tax=Glaesserella australis TaxID=2094024 RepID=A0A328BYK1_9PAST|nr:MULTISPECIES: glycosyltransferase family 25 protein [Glaesserella]AUI65265.1 Lsg locus protein 4 [Glaesserella sp. 15-184]RAL18537.1 Lsg locus protein 4 [Glaesserella australis]
MKKYLISLDKDSHRRELFFAQPDTADFSVFSAFNTMNEDEQSLATRFNLTQFSEHYGRKVTKGEVGCTLSHLGVYQQICDDKSIADEEYCLVCEDDALFNQDFQANLIKILNEKPTADLILVGQSKIATFDDIELEINYPTTFANFLKKVTACPFVLAYPYKNYFAGTVAYLIKKSIAQKILNQVNQNGLPYWLADDFILFGDKFGLDIQVVRPLMVIENPNLNSNLESIRGSIAHGFFTKLAKYPLKKLLAVKRNLGK